MAHAQGPDAIGITEGQQAVAGNQHDHGIRATHPPVHRTDRAKHVGRRQRQALGRALQLVRQHVEEHLGIALGVDVPVVGGEQLGLEGVRVGQVAVVHQHDAEGGIDVEGLGFFLAVGIAGRRVAHLPQAATPGQRAHVARAEDVAHHALGLVHEELAIQLRDDARSVLAPVLQQQQGVVDQLIDRRVADNADDSTHSSIPFAAELAPAVQGPAPHKKSGRQILPEGFRQHRPQSFQRGAQQPRARRSLPPRT
jgi:hypothetical protein